MRRGEAKKESSDNSKIYLGMGSSVEGLGLDLALLLVAQAFCLLDMIKKIINKLMSSMRVSSSKF